MRYPNASTEPLEIIRLNECEAAPGLATARFQALWNEIERLRVAFLSCLQHENECAKRGRLCGPGDSCGCKLEMEDYLEDSRALGQSPPIGG